ncbi:MAG: hypothetical protein ACRCWF_06200 [Beijerinckiaceae bacterium]
MPSRTFPVKSLAMSDTPSITYTHRAKPYGGGAIFELTADRLIITQGVIQSEMLLADINRIELVYRPRNSTSEGYRARIEGKNRHTVFITNLTFRNAMSIDRQDEDYRRFITALIAAVGKANPALQLVAGVPLWMNIISGVAGGTTVVALMLMAGNALYDRNFPIAMLIVFMGVYFGWWVWRYVMHNRPRTFTPDSIPPEVMPPLARPSSKPSAKAI